jgi:pantoate--beta-alanine ligase
MLQVQTIRRLKEALAQHRSSPGTTGFVPTMGALHEGHLALVRRSLAENQVTVASIFVNPTQFNNPEDLARYPRMPERDAGLLEKTGCDILFAPAVAEMYPEGDSMMPEFDLGSLGLVMEGKFRPGHFRGVAQIVMKLFVAVSPDNAYFGKKDFQQLAVIRKLVRDFRLPVEIVGCETVREPDGLAMSSRNMLLTPEQRNLAPRIFEVLRRTKSRAGLIPPGNLAREARLALETIPGFRVEYFEIADPVTLLPLVKWQEERGAVACTAVFAGNVRLIDNMELFS